jgi:hypothetical protein
MTVWKAGCMVTIRERCQQASHSALFQKIAKSAKHMTEPA